ncbi:MAG: type II secretion system protein [bacterium]|nr:type II secretion system protein [bacterium]
MISKKYAQGFSLVEMMIIVLILSGLSVLLISNFGSSKTNATARHQVSQVIVADVRRAQSLALSGAGHLGQPVCGYGLHWIDSGSYIIYSGAPEGGVPSCATANRNYQSGIDSILSTSRIDNTKLGVVGIGGASFNDIFFESPDPRVYIDGTYNLNTTVDIQVITQGQACISSTCTTVTVSGSGSVGVAN